MQDGGALNGTGSLQTVDGSSPKNQTDVSQLREELRQLISTQSDGYFLLAEKLTRVVEEGIFREWDYPEWQDYVENELGMGKRKAQYFMSIHRWITNVVKTRKFIDRLKKFGWSKTRLLVPVATDQSLEEWLDRAESMTYSQLEEFIKRLKDEKRNKDGQGDGDDLKMITFKMFPAQEQSLEDAMEIAGRISESDKRGHNLSLICDDFTASNRFSLRPGQKMMSLYLEKIANQLGVNLVASERGSREIITGKQHVAAQAAVLSKKDKRELIVGLTTEEGLALLSKTERETIFDQLLEEFGE